MYRLVSSEPTPEAAATVAKAYPAQRCCPDVPRRPLRLCRLRTTRTVSGPVHSDAPLACIDRASASSNVTRSPGSGRQPLQGRL
jgi:hypothetical protein